MTDTTVAEKTQKEKFFDTIMAAKDAVLSLPPFGDPNKFWREFYGDYSDDDDSDRDKLTAICKKNDEAEIRFSGELKSLVAKIPGVNLRDEPGMNPISLLLGGGGSARSQTYVWIECGIYSAYLDIDASRGIYCNVKDVYIDRFSINAEYENLGKFGVFYFLRGGSPMFALAEKIRAMPVDAICIPKDGGDDENPEERLDVSCEEEHKILRVGDFLNFNEDRTVSELPVEKILNAYFINLAGGSFDIPYTPADFDGEERCIQALFNSELDITARLEQDLPREFQQFKEHLARLYKEIAYAQRAPFFFDEQPILLKIGEENKDEFEIERKIRLSAKPRILSMEQSAYGNRIRCDKFDDKIRDLLDTEFF
jgi:hypothetical protein